MAKINPIEIVASMSGKLCSHSRMYFVTNKQTGAVTTGKICYPSKKEPTEAQLAQRQAFATRSRLVADWINDNKPSSDNPTGTAEYKKLLARFKSQHKIGNFFGYASKVLLNDGTLSMPQIENGQGSGDGGGSNPTPKKTLTLTVSPANGGSTTGAGQYDQGATANITATPASGFVFSKWSDNNTSASRTVTVNSDMTLTAVFTSTNPGGGSEEDGGDDA